MELYSFQMEERDEIEDHINSLKLLACQLLNVDENKEDSYYFPLLLFASSPKSSNLIM